MRRHWQGISTPVILRLPNGTEWKVYWLKRDGDVWFHNGWKEFAEYLSLEESQFLVFRYEGKSKFSVIVLGLSGLEIKYPSSKEDAGKGQKVNHESDCSLEILKGKRPRSPSPSSEARKKMKKSPKEEPESYSIHAENKHRKKKAYADSDNATKHKNSGVFSSFFFLLFYELIKSFLSSIFFKYVWVFKKN